MSERDFNRKNRKFDNNRTYNNRDGSFSQNRGNNFKYVGAPYNFVSFTKNVYEYPQEKIVGHNEMSQELFNGEIAYEITAKTSIIVDDGEGHFHKNPWGEYSIPGSTMRGLIRNNVQILGLSSFGDDIDDYALMFRDVTGGDNKDYYNNNVMGADTIPIDNGKKKSSVSILRNVKAGYIANEDGKYVIYQTDVDSIGEDYGEMNYYVLSERKIVEEYLKSKGKNFCYDFFLHDGKSIMQNQYDKPFTKSIGKNGKPHYRGRPNGGYKPGFEEVSYKLKNDRDVIAVGARGKYEKEGYAMNSGKMNEKKAIYIIPKENKDKGSISIPMDDIKAFQIDLKKRKSTLKPYEYFTLPKSGEFKPVFYIYSENHLYFGFTPRLRVFYTHTIKDGLLQEHKADILDYSKVIFGYSDKKKSRKSKVSFSDAVVVGKARELEERGMTLAEPKPTSYYDYLKQEKDGKIVTYNDSKIQLRGGKQYWLHKEEEKGTIGNEHFTPLEKGTRFVGKIRFRNMTEEELGLLLWSVQLEEGKSWLNVGKAKSYGYGNISLEIKEVKKINLSKAYADGETLDLNPFENVDVEKTIQQYKDSISQEIGKRIDEIPHIKDFFTMKDSTCIPNSKTIRYMELEEYTQRKRTRNKPLPTIRQVVKKKEN